MLEVGARDINGSVRSLFGRVEYIATDIEPGPGVDLVAPGEQITLPRPVDTVVCCEVLEHTEAAEAICRNAYQLLAPGGAFIVTAAAPPRAEHSAVDGGELFEGEFYRNVGPGDLGAWLSDFDVMEIVVDEDAGDIRAIALKAGQPAPPADDEPMERNAAGFLDMTYMTRVWESTFWRGHRALKSPLDLWIYQELLTEIRPALVIETGTYEGGSAFYMGDVLMLLDAHSTGEPHGTVLSIDIAPRARPPHPRVDYLYGASSTDPRVLGMVADLIASLGGPVMVVLDSDHSAQHVLDELRAYADLVTPGSYLIVEDTAVNGHPIDKSFGPGPWEAVNTFLAARSDFTVDRSREKFGATFHPRGFLRKGDS